MFSLRGKLAIVTGGAGLLGSAIALGLGRQGARVVIASRQTIKHEAVRRELTEMGCECHSVELDIGEPDSVERAFARVEREAGGLDILVNCAQRSRSLPSSRMDPATWALGLAGGVSGTFWCCQAAQRSMSQRGGGSIVNVASILAHRSPLPNPDAPAAGPASSYATNKGAVLALTRFLAVEWAQYGIRVNAITPGAFPREAQPLPSVPLGRSGRPEELVGAVTLLASAAGSYITGQELAIDGGWSATL